MHIKCLNVEEECHKSYVFVKYTLSAYAVPKVRRVIKYDPPLATCLRLLHPRLKKVNMRVFHLYRWERTDFGITLVWMYCTCRSKQQRSLNFHQHYRALLIVEADERGCGVENCQSGAVP